MNVREWKDIPGYNGKYQANFNGQIRRLYKSTKPRVLSQFPKVNDNKMYVKLECKDVNVAHIIWKTFKGEIPKGFCIIHKNRMQTDNCINNLELINKRTLGIRYGMLSRQLSVVKINASGEIVDAYRSARECGRQNFMSYQTVIDRCNGKCKSAFAPDGFAYAWEDSEISMKKAIRKVEIHNGYMVSARDVVFDF